MDIIKRIFQKNTSYESDIIKQIFQKYSAYESGIFSPALSDRIILICCRILTKDQYEALKKTAAEFNEYFLYAFALAKEMHNSPQKKIKKIRFDSYSDYAQYDLEYLSPEGVHYSPSGLWGIIFSDNEFGIMGAKPDFMNLFKINYPLYREHMMIFDVDREGDNKLRKSKINWVGNVMQNFPKKLEYSSEKSRLFWRKSVKQNIRDLIETEPGTKEWDVFMERHFSELFLEENFRYHKGVDFWVSRGYLTTEEGVMLKPFNENLTQFWEIFHPPRNKEWKLKWEEVKRLSQKIEFKD